MGLFGKKKTRHIVEEPLPVWNDALWRSHLRSCAVGTEHHLGIYAEQIKKDRKECARLYRNENHLSCRKAAAGSLANTRIVTVLNALSPICNALHRRTESLAGYTSLAQVQEPARAGIVTIIFAAAHLNMSYLTDTVDFLREQFSPMHIEEVQAGEGPLAPLINPMVRNCIDTKFPTRPDVDTEIAHAVREFLGIDIDHQDDIDQVEQIDQQNINHITRQISDPTFNTTNSQLPTPYPSSPPHISTEMDNEDDNMQLPPAPSVLSNNNNTNPISSQEAIRFTQTTPISVRSSEIGTAISPQLSQQPAGMGTNVNIPPMADEDTYNANRMFATHSNSGNGIGSLSTATALAESRKARDSLAASLESGAVKRGRSGEDNLRASISGGLRVGEGLRPGDGMLEAQVAARERDHLHAKALQLRAQRQRDMSDLPKHLQEFEDSDGMLLKRYQILTMVLAM